MSLPKPFLHSSEATKHDMHSISSLGRKTKLSPFHWPIRAGNLNNATFKSEGSRLRDAQLGCYFPCPMRQNTALRETRENKGEKSPILMEAIRRVYGRLGGVFTIGCCRDSFLENLLRECLSCGESKYHARILGRKAGFWHWIIEGCMSLKTETNNAIL